jgi:curved DNA-binding protein CbpA
MVVAGLEAQEYSQAMQPPDYYVVLEVPTNASLEQIKQSYRRLVRLYHPDINQESEDVCIKQLNEAYAVLSDPLKRIAYDVERLENLRNALRFEAIGLQQKKAPPAQKMTWREGIIGFVRELKKGLRDE